MTKLVEVALPLEAISAASKRVAAGGVQPAAELLREARAKADEARSLVYWLSLAAAAKGWTTEVRDYDALVTEWPELVRIAEQQEAPVEEGMR